MFDLNKVYSAENGTDIFFKYIKPPPFFKVITFYELLSIYYSRFMSFYL